MTINIILNPGEHTSFRSSYLKPVFEKYFSIQDFDPTTRYDTKSIFVTNMFSDPQWAKSLYDNGYKVAVDNLWELPVHTPYYRILHPNWFWYNESLWYTALGYKDLSFRPAYKKLAFVPINRVKPFRDQFINKIEELLADCIYSYKDRSLPDDIDKSNLGWERYVNPSWYSDTYFSLVVETLVSGPKFTTEKSFKPMAFRHPYIIIGQPGILSRLKHLGFETYDNLFDESYDTILNFNLRANAVIKTIKNFIKQPYDSITLEKIEHNYNLFYDRELVITKIQEEIIQPLIDFANE